MEVRTEESVTLTQAVTRLERRLKRLQFWCLGSTFCFFAIAALGWTAATQEVIKAKRLEIIGPDGQAKVVLEAATGNPTMRMSTSQDPMKPYIELGANTLNSTVLARSGKSLTCIDSGTPSLGMRWSGGGEFNAFGGATGYMSYRSSSENERTILTPTTNMSPNQISALGN